MLHVALRTPHVRLQPPRSRCGALTSTLHRDSKRQDRSSGSRLEATRFPAQSTFSRERSHTPNTFALVLLRDVARSVSSRACHARSLSPDLRSETPSRARHFFGARRSLGSSSREHAPEGRQEPSDRLLPPNKLLYRSAPVLSTLAKGTELTPRFCERLVGSRRPSLLWRDRSMEGKVFACRPRDDLHR